MLHLFLVDLLMTCSKQVNISWEEAKENITAGKVSKYGVFLFSSNAGNYGPEKTLYLDTFHVVHGIRAIIEKHFL